jgi:hypothetical protein
VDSSSDGWIMSARLSLLESTVAIDDFYPSLCAITVAMNRMLVATIAYGLLLEWCVVVVNHESRWQVFMINSIVSS